MTTDDQVYDAARSVLERGLGADDSAFTPGCRVWTRAHAQELARRVANPPDGVTGTFLDRLVAELADADPLVVQLAAEVLYLHYLVAMDIAGPTKRLGLQRVLKLIPGSGVVIPSALDAALDGGVIRVGMAYKAYRAQQITWLAELVAHWKSQPAEHVRAALVNPWAFREIVDEVPTTTAAGQRRALLHLAFPQVFLDSLLAEHLTAVVTTFGHEVGPLTGDGERDFFAIRQVLEATSDVPVDFFESPWAEQWGWGIAQGGDPPPRRRGWLVRGANVSGRNLVPEWLTDGYCSISFPDYPPVEPGLTKSALAHIVRDAEPGLSPSQEGAQIGLLDKFLNRMASGDIVVTVNDSRVYVGILTGGPYWVPDVVESHRRRYVQWVNTSAPLRRSDLSDTAQDRLSGQATIVDLGEAAREIADLAELDGSDGGAPALVAVLPEPETVVVEQAPLVDLPEPAKELAKRLLVDIDWLAETVDLLNEKKQLVLYGPPGTGKTYLAQEIAKFLAEETNGEHRLVQFHPSYAYEDFIEGFRPGLTADGTFRFAKEPGPFRRLVDAAAQNPSGAYVLVIDEINRANLAKVFGELYFLLEYRNRTIGLQYSPDEDFTLPRNVFLIGTMNTADRSIALVDAAMRRRFAWQSLFPGEPPVADMLRRWLAEKSLPIEVADLLDALNAAIADRDATVGPSYLMSPRVATGEGLARIWRTQILPLLEERHLGEHADVAGYVRGRYGLDVLQRGRAVVSGADGSAGADQGDADTAGGTVNASDA
ncbi:McrB family protein [Frankia sp. CiP3]|uniref:McrB family protein n=1 Tax=Frankia sp. CiP3 TaxID=2880971 RepID=UPI001EF6F412|nr:AAA family ATPase [Frankia sp. CiP3]